MYFPARVARKPPAKDYDSEICCSVSVDLPCRQQESEALGLTPRQYEVLVLLARGHTLKAIGRHLNIAVATAKVHAETVYQRLQVHNRNEAVYAAITRGATLGWPAMVREAAVQA
nr:LuxR C-terminal-related transcriptional regulator [Bordetella sp. BOR01]